MDNFPLIAITFQRNRMELNSNTIEKLAFDGQATDPQTTKLYLWCRRITRILPGTFNKFPLLQSLELSFNAVVELPKDVFSSLHQLRVISLYKNKIRMIDGDLFKNNKALEYINLEDNEIEKIGKDTFADLPQLEKLYLHKNKLEEFDFESMKASTNLKYLNFSNNRLTEIKGFQKFGSIYLRFEWCDLRGNALSSSHLKNVARCWDAQKIRIEGIDGSRGIQYDCVYGIPCVPDVVPLQKQVNALELKFTNATKDHHNEIEYLKDENYKLRMELDSLLNEGKRVKDEEKTEKDQSAPSEQSVNQEMKLIWDKMNELQRDCERLRKHVDVLTPGSGGQNDAE